MYVLEYRLWYAYVLDYCFRIACLRTLFSLVGAQVCLIRRADSRRGTGFLQEQWRRFNAQFFLDLSNVY